MLRWRRLASQWFHCISIRLSSRPSLCCCVWKDWQATILLDKILVHRTKFLYFYIFNEAVDQGFYKRIVSASAESFGPISIKDKRSGTYWAQSQRKRSFTVHILLGGTHSISLMREAANNIHGQYRSSLSFFF